MAEGCPRQGGQGGACGCGHPRGGVPGRPGVFAPQSLGWRGEPGSVSGRCWVWAASSLGFEAWVGPQRLTSPAGGPGAAKEVGWRLVREQEPADARGMPPAPLPPVMQFFIVGGLAVPQPLPADRKLGIRGLAPAERGGRDRASSLSTRCRPRSQLEFLVSTTPLPPGQERQTPPSPAGSEPQGALEGAGGREGVSSLCLRSGFLVPRRAPPTLSLFPVSQVGMSPARALGAALGHSSAATCGAGPGPWNPSFRAGERDCAASPLPRLPAPPRAPSSSAGAGLSLGRRQRGTRDSWAVTPRWAHGRRTRCPHSRGRGTPFTPAGSPAAALHPGSVQAQAPRPPPSPPSPGLGP